MLRYRLELGPKVQQKLEKVKNWKREYIYIAYSLAHVALSVGKIIIFRIQIEDDVPPPLIANITQADVGKLVACLHNDWNTTIPSFWLQGKMARGQDETIQMRLLRASSSFHCLKALPLVPHSRYMVS